MRRSLIWFVLLALSTPTLAQEERRQSGGPLPLEESPPRLSYGFETDFNSRYVWRGLTLSGGAVQQSAAWVTKGPLTYTLWSNFVLGKGENRGRFDEVDLTIAYSREGKHFNFQPSLNVYLYPQGTADPTAELTLRFTRPFGPAQLFTSQSIDFIEGRGAYFGEVGVERERQIGDHLTLKGCLSVGWASKRFTDFNVGLSHAGLHVVGGQMALNYQGKGFYVRPHVGMTALLSSKVRDQVEDPSLFSFGLAVGKAW